MEQIIKDNAPDFEYKIEHFYYILGLLQILPLENRETIDDEGFVSVNATILRKHILDSKKYVDYLVDHVLDRKEYSIKEKRSYSYRYKPEFEGEVQFKEINILTKPRRKNKHVKGQMVAQQKYPYLTKHYNSKLKIDYEAAIDWIENHPERYMRKGKMSTFDYNRHRYSVELIHKGEFFTPFVDDTVGRFYSAIVSLKSELRNFLTYNGERLVSIDLTASQIFCSSYLFDLDFYRKNKNFPQKINFKDLHAPIKEHYKRLIRKNPTPHLSTSSLMMLNKCIVLDSEGIMEYKKLALEGLIYERIQDKLKSEQGVIIMERSELKEVVFRSIYSSNGAINLRGNEKITAPIKMFKMLFPEVFDLFYQFKKRNHRFLSRMLQNVEAVFVLERIAGRFSKEFPFVPIYPVHDCLIVPESLKSDLERIIDEESMRAFGMIAPYKSEFLFSENLRCCA